MQWVDGEMGIPDADKEKLRKVLGVPMNAEEDPVQKVLFYDHQDPDKSFYLQSNKISQLLPANFQEKRIRWWYTGVDQFVYQQCKHAFEKIKSII